MSSRGPIGNSSSSSANSNNSNSSNNGNSSSSCANSNNSNSSNNGNSLSSKAATNSNTNFSNSIITSSSDNTNSSKLKISSYSEAVVGSNSNETSDVVVGSNSTENDIKKCNLAIYMNKNNGMPQIELLKSGKCVKFSIPTSIGNPNYKYFTIKLTDLNQLKASTCKIVGKKLPKFKSILENTFTSFNFKTKDVIVGNNTIVKEYIIFNTCASCYCNPDVVCKTSICASIGTSTDTNIEVLLAELAAAEAQAAAANLRLKLVLAKRK